jgi:hypothetical protein
MREGLVSGPLRRRAVGVAFWNAQQQMFALIG